jgi:hypothetical protein
MDRRLQPAARLSKGTNPMTHRSLRVVVTLLCVSGTIAVAGCATETGDPSVQPSEGIVTPQMTQLPGDPGTSSSSGGTGGGGGGGAGENICPVQSVAITSLARATDMGEWLMDISCANSASCKAANAPWVKHPCGPYAPSNTITELDRNMSYLQLQMIFGACTWTTSSFTPVNKCGYNTLQRQLSCPSGTTDADLGYWADQCWGDGTSGFFFIAAQTNANGSEVFQIDPEDVTLYVSIGRTNGSTASAYYNATGIGTSVVRWGSTWTSSFSDGSPHGGQPCTTSNLGAYATTQQRIAESGSQRICQ